MYVKAEDHLQTIYSPTGDEIYQILISDPGTLKVIGHHYGGVSLVTYQTVGFFVSMQPQNSDIRSFLRNGGKGYELRFDNETDKYVKDVNNNGYITTTYSFPDNLLPELFRLFNVPANSTGEYTFYISNIFRVIQYPQGRGYPFVYISDACYSLAEIRNAAYWGSGTMATLAHYYDMKFTVKRSWVKPTATPTPTATNSPTPTVTNTPTPTRRPTYTPTPTPRPTNTPTPRPTNTPTPTPTNTPTPTPTNSPTPTPYICKLVVSSDNKQYVQLVKPDDDALPLVIENANGMNDFYLKVINNVSGLAGKGEIKNFVRFPFQLYDDLLFTGEIENALPVASMTWYEVGDDVHHFLTSNDLTEGNYRLEGKSEAKAANDAKTVSDAVNVQISGRLTDLSISITDVSREKSSSSDSVRESILMPASNSRIRYFGGIKNRFGIMERADKPQLPAVAGETSGIAEIEVTTCGKSSAEGAVKINIECRTPEGEKVSLLFYETLPDGSRKLLAFPKTVSLSLVEKSDSSQIWRGSLNIPDNLIAVREGSGSSRYSGEVIVNFDISLLAENGDTVLSYANTQNASRGYCNMWTFQAYQTERTDASGKQYDFIPGDVLIMDVSDASASKKIVRLIY